ncbi:NAD(P)H-dependent oxidoreductase [Enterococcus asini]|uniref:NAD(P)H-dependent oxidoreductase n=1 Tax=Enterococcus asini TaxID=57732 RepID=A0AAW8TVY1_9ENTE|nr:NAD(P)H-dependent oxidoreductase [Enterococcus asini]MCD5028183.1 NAD(P)H-dependent oxidoreductase [Enterococcus asini]MDT2744024.1 NAD(P)H-dependent oxidoreductase [Enterococcus asini]MDT2762946.1 NAD(P)H-dependent oxidoreductase [Enterococcus asini]MDT2809100.1 NAD(P)H-dependent oxidoreductase [Enterococcus asini]OJG11330.1 flavin reductase [Enterococcus asini]
MTKKIGFIVGSLRTASYNKKVAHAFAELLPEDFEAVFLEIGNLPLYNEDLDAEGHIPVEWQAFRDQLMPLDGVFFFTPEYNRSVPGALKNALDVGSRPYGQSSWDGKPALVVSVSPGAIGGFGANHHLRQSLVFLNMPTLQQPEAYIGGINNLMDEDGNVQEGTLDYFKTIVGKYVEFFNKLKA